MPPDRARRLLWAVIPALAVWAVFALFAQTQPGRRIERLVFDAMSVATAPAREPATWLATDLATTASQTSIVIVGIDEASFAELDRPWPWPRGLHARLIDQLKAAGAAVIAFDVLFAEPTDPEQDRQLAKAVGRAGNVVLAADLAIQETGQYQMAMRVEPIPALRQAGARSGLASISLDPDMVVRALPLEPGAFWRQVVGRYRGTEPLAGSAPPPGALARYLGPDHSFRYVSYYQALDPGRLLPPGTFAGKIVLVGHDSKVALNANGGGGEAFATPFSTVSGMRTPGVELHATFIANGLAGLAIRETPVPWTVGLLGLVLLLMSLPSRDWHPARAALVGLGLMAACAGLAVWLFAARQVWLPVASALLAIAALYVIQVGGAFLRERIQRRRLRAMFARYVSPNRVAYLVEHPESLRLGGERRQCSFVFTDLAGFTSLMERIEPETAVSLLNDYLDQMVAIAFEHDGTLDRVVGDAVAILFSAPVVQPDHQRRALRCALAMRDFSDRFAQRANARGIAFGMTRIGVHSGEVTVGNFGGKTIFDYRALGDAVNTAARLESVNKHLGTRMCVSEATLAGCPGVPARPVGQLVLKGKALPVMAFEPIIGIDAGQALPDTEYEAAYAALEGDPAAAPADFRRLAAERPDDGLVSFHLRRLEAGQTGTEIVFAEK